jgi:RNA polymerase sigma-70 factor (ECF subfamily)
MAPEPRDLTSELEQYREYLGLLARMQLGGRFRGKVDLSGVVQQTLLEAHQARQQFQQQAPDRKAAWLRRILANNLRDEIRRLGAAARDIARERPLDAALEDSSSRIQAWLAAEQPSPSQVAMREEQLLALADALTRLPADQRQAVELHHLQGCPLAEVAAQLGRSKGAVAALLFRGLKRLRALLADPEGS